MCDGHLNLKEQLRLMADCDHWARRAERAEAEVQRLKAALYKVAEDAEVAHQGGLHDGGVEPTRCSFWRSANRCTYPHAHEGRHSFESARIDGADNG